MIYRGIIISLENISFDSTSDLDRIQKIFLQFINKEEFPRFIEQEKFQAKLKNQKIKLYFCTKNNSVINFIFVDYFSSVLSSYYYKTKDSSNDEQNFINLLNNIYLDNQARNLPLFRSVRDFDPNEEIQLKLKTSNFFLFERYFMALNLSDVDFNLIKLKTIDKTFKLSMDIKNNTKTIIDLIYTSVEGTIDSRMYPEYNSKENIAELFNLRPGDQNIFNDTASTLLFFEEQLIGLNLISKGKVPYIFQLAVHKAYQGKGIGKYLMIKSMKILDSIGIKEIRLHVSKQNSSALHIYESLGFKRAHSTWVILR